MYPSSEATNVYEIYLTAFHDLCLGLVFVLNKCNAFNGVDQNMCLYVFSLTVSTMLK